MTTLNRRIATRSLIALAIAAAFPLHGAMAQQTTSAPQAQTGQLETVIVTAQRRSENIKDVPMAITALKGEKLDVLTSGGHDIRLLSGRAPSLVVESDYGRSFPRFYIRGQGNTDFDLNASQPVGLVVDDIVQESPMLKGFPIFDVDQVEVLRGPQGTLFGRNSPAGVIKFDSAKPVLGKTEGYASLGLGNYKAVNAEGVYNVPLGATVAARLSVQSQNRDDRVTNTRPNAATREFEGYNDHAARLQVLYKPHNRFSALFNVHGRDMTGNAMLFRANILKQGTNDLVDNFDYDSYSTDGGNEQWLKSKGANARLRWDLDGLTVHSITGYETVDFYSRGDVDGGYGCNVFCQIPDSGPGRIPFPVETADLLPDHGQFTQEVRVESSNKGPLQWIAGLFYFNEDIQIDSISYNSLAPGNPLNTDFARQTQDSKAYALFGSLNYTVSDRLKLRGGLRYTQDRKHFEALRANTVTGLTSGPFALSAKSSNVSGDISGTYELDADTNLYARIATGYRAPSFQGRLNGPGDRPSDVGAEKAISFEAGIKKDFFNRRARMAATVFQYTVNDKQLTAGSGTINMNELVPADKVTGQGVELDLQANLGDAWRVTVGGSYNDTEIKDANLFVQTCGNEPNTILAGEGRGRGCTVIGRPGPVAGTQLLDGNPLPRAPKWQGNFSLRYRMDIADGELYALTDWAYRSTHNMFLYEAAEYKAKSLLEGGLRVGYKWDNYEVAAYARNLTNEIQTVAAIDFNNLTGMVNEPRTFGVQLKASF